MSHVSPRSPDFTDEEEQGRRVLVPKHVFAHGHLRKFVLKSFFRKKAQSGINLSKSKSMVWGMKETKSNAAHFTC